MILLASSLAAPVVVTLDNGGFNLPLYAPQAVGGVERPSAARQFLSDLSRSQGEQPRVFTYLPPGRTAGSPSQPHEVVPSAACPPGGNCWSGVDVNRHPASSTSLYQATMGMRRVVQGPRFEVHLTDLFEEDPASVNRPSDADRCVTRTSTQRALEAVFDKPEGSLDHVAVGRLRAQVRPSSSASGGIVQFVESEGPCWTGKRIGALGRDEVQFDMGVVIVGIDTANEDAAFRQLVEGLERQVGDPLALSLVTVREPPTVGSMGALVVNADQPEVYMAPPLARMTPCASVTAQPLLWSGGAPVPAGVQARCEGSGQLSFQRGSLSQLFRSQAGMNPMVGSLELAGEVRLTGDVATPMQEVAELIADPAEHRPLVHWGALVASLRFEDGGVARPREHRVTLQQVQVLGIDDRPWLLAIALSLLPLFLIALLAYRILSRIAANRAFRRHLDSNTAANRPVALVLAEATEEAEQGWAARLAVSMAAGVAASALGLVAMMLADGWLHG